MKSWSHLPNADLIDWVLESMKTDPEKWIAVWTATHAATHAATRAATSAATSAATLDAARTATLDAALDAALEATRNTAAWHPIWTATQNAILALIAYDDCDQYLNMSYEQLLTWATLSERPQVVLLLPLKWIQEHEQTLVTST